MISRMPVGDTSAKESKVNEREDARVREEQ